MIIDANGVQFLKQLQRKVLLQSAAADGYVDGEYSKRLSPPVEKNLIILPISGEDLKNSEAGFYTADDKMILEVGACSLKLKDRFTFNLQEYEIIKIADYIFEANIAKYIAKHIWASP